MNTLDQFRRWFYLAMFLGMGVLAYSESDLLPEVGLILAVATGTLIAAYRVERRWSLSLRDANLVGLLMGIFIISWVGAQFFWSESLIYQLPWPASLLPYLGPVVMLLIPAKLLRPKHAGDYWAMFAMSFLCVALGCSMAEDVGAWLLIMLWLYAALRSLEWFVRCRDLRLILAPTEAGTVATTPLGNFSRLARPLASRRFVGIAVFGTVAFLLTPRLDTPPWELLSRGRIETGLTEKEPIDLTRTGNLTPTKDRVYEVFVQDREGRAVAEIDPNTRWRARHLQKYEGGRWHPETRHAAVIRERAGDTKGAPAVSHPKAPGSRFPDFGADELFLTYKALRRDAPRMMLMEPVMWRAFHPEPAASDVGGQVFRWKQMQDAQFNLETRPGPRIAHYQAWAPPSEPGLSPGMRVATYMPDEILRVAGLASVQKYAKGLLVTLVREGKLPPEVGARIDTFDFPAAQDHEAVARAFDAYFASGRDFTYSLELNRIDRKLDPIEDFLFNTRSGHCERFTTALVMCLRSVGVPCQMVVGYKGCDPRGDGWFDIRQEHAHAWAEVLIARPDPADETRPRFHWLALDPTPGVEALADEQQGSWLSEAQKTGSQIFRQLFLNTGPIGERIEAVTARASAWFEKSGDLWPVWVGVVLASLVVSAWLYRRRKRLPREGASGEPPALLAAWARILAPVVGLPEAGRTWGRFARDLREHPRMAGYSDLLDELDADVAAFYRHNYARHAPPPGWAAARRERLAQLRPRFDQWRAAPA